jgi:hypothetical protein
LNNARATALDCERLERRDRGLGIVRVGDHAHLRLHSIRGQVNEHIAALTTVEKMYMRIVRKHFRNRIIWRPVRRNRGADEFGGDYGRRFIVEV